MIKPCRKVICVDDSGLKQFLEKNKVYIIRTVHINESTIHPIISLKELPERFFSFVRFKGVNDV